MTERIVSYRPGAAGSRSAFEAVATAYRYLSAKYDYDITIVTSPEDGYRDPELNVVEIDASFIENPVTARFSRNFGIPDPKRMVSKTAKELLRTADGIITAGPIGFLHAHAALRFAIDNDIPVWYESSKTTASKFREFRWKFQRRSLISYLRRASGVIATTPMVLERFQDLNLASEEIFSNVHVVGHPVDTDLFRPIDRPNTAKTKILVVSRMVPEKGMYYITEALIPLVEAFDDLTVEIFGEGTLKPLLERVIRNNGVTDSFSFSGTVPHDELPKKFATADIYVNHAVDTKSWEEFFGVANIEAMACGLPCVLSDSGAIPYVVRGENCARIVRQRHVGELCSTIRSLIESPSERNLMKQKARKFVVENYSITAVGDRYHHMLQEELD